MTGAHRKTTVPKRFGGAWALPVFALFAVSFFAGCLRRNSTDESAPLPTVRFSVPVVVESRFREDLTLFVIHDGIASRVQRIGSSSTSRFTLPPHLVGSLGELTLLVEGVGARSGMSERFTTGRLRVLPGQGIVWTLETRLERSFAQVVPAETIVIDTVK